jgi:predicted kinase
MFRLLFASLLSLSPLYAQFDPPVDKVKENIVSSLSQTLIGQSESNPLLILIGGYVGSGKTTLSNALKDEYGITVFSLNSIRQALLDQGIDIRGNKTEERSILSEVYPRLLAPCIANSQHIVIDANANRQGIEDALNFLNTHSGGDKYQIVKIHLEASEEELFKRVHARMQQADLHQGTAADLEYELRTPAKAIYPEDYDLVIDTEHTSFENEMKILRGFLQLYL